MSKLVLTLLLLLLVNNSFAEDLGVTVQGSTIDDNISNLKTNDDSVYLSDEKNSIDKLTTSETSPLLPDSKLEEVKAPSAKSEYTGTGYTLPGTFEKQENYIEIDKKNYAKNLRNQSTMAFNLTYIRDNFTYDSPNNIIQRTFNQTDSAQTGFLIMRFDNYFYHTQVVNLHWSLGGGLAFNYGKGIFVTGETSNAQFRLWEIPLDAGLGAEISLTRWIKLSITGGPSILTLIQNRGDLTQHEPGKNKAQFGFGGFGSAQVKFNLTGISGETAHELFSSNGISNMYLNLEGRYQSYQKYLDSIKISGASFGVGVSFEFL